MAEPTLAPDIGQDRRQPGAAFGALTTPAAPAALAKAAAPADAAAPAAAAAWSAARWLGFRFAFVYLLICDLPVAVSWIPATGWLAARYQELFFRRTATLGAMLAVAAMTNVVIINFSYDVSVKLWALNLLLMAAFLLAPDLRRLADLLVLQRPTAPRNIAPPPGGPRWRRIGPLVLKAVVIGYLVIPITKTSLDRWRQWDRVRTRYEARQSTAYEVDDFVRNGRPVQPSPHEPRRWQSLSFGPRGAVVGDMDDRPIPVDYDAVRQTLAVPSGDRRTNLGVLTCSRPDADHLVLTGTLASDSLVVTLHSRDLKRYFLASRGFHWIDEAPEDR